ncbi:Rgt1p PWA37_000256 [Arxiozyma heterogenica]|uniref:Zn(2)-C6 fungal-type domain-containing protein n=1 Tax=Arxiozyma heterogenica TaxID=278026 RepID=A0AAN7WL30_9SACH|nr:hypothetical protein RI543_004154 [Kazachstania heterogenica]
MEESTIDSNQKNIINKNDIQSNLDSTAASSPEKSVTMVNASTSPSNANKHDRTTPSETQVKKRTKASRACDQCRKKKIKCDYNELKSICGYCERNNETCSFIRVPLKRGPSKGYNKLYKASSSNHISPLQDSNIVDNNSKKNNNLSNMNLYTALNKNTITPNDHTVAHISNNYKHDSNRLSTNNAVITSQQSNQVLLPPLSQYVPSTNLQQANSNTNENSTKTSLVNENDTLHNTNRNTVQNIVNQIGQLTPTLNFTQQQFWKVPYHDFPLQKRTSIDSLGSDLSMRNINLHENTMYNSGTIPIQNHSNNTTTVMSSNFIQTISAPSPITENNVSNSNTLNTSLLDNGIHPVGGGRSNSITGNTNNTYWPYIKNLNHTSNEEEQNIPFRRTSSIPSLLRQTSSTNIAGQNNLHNSSTNQLPQPYSYSQFYQQAHQQTMGPINSFDNFATSGFHTRHGSIASEAMSPGTSANTNERTITPSKTKKNSLESTSIKSIITPSLEKEKPSTTVSNTTKPLNGITNDSTRHDYFNNSSRIEVYENKSDKHVPSIISLNSIMHPIENNINEHKEIKYSGIKSGHNSSINSSSNPTELLNSPSYTLQLLKDKQSITNSHRTSASVISTPNGNNFNCPAVIYGQISYKELIDIYYEFIHIGFPIIPLNKKMLQDEILMHYDSLNSAIQELNDYVFLWFRNSLELLVRLAIKRGSGHSLFDTRISSLVRSNITGTSNNDNPGGNGLDNKDDQISGNGSDLKRNDYFEIQTVFISALNECFQKIVDIHPKFRENKDLISPRIKVIYLCTFIILNYILSYVGYDNSFVLGMSVTIFNEFKLYKQLLVGEILTRIEKTNEDTTYEIGYSLIFKRLYILLIIFDSLQSCVFGGPKLLNIPINSTIDKFFDSFPGSEFYNNYDQKFIERWCVENDTTKLAYIIESLHLGEMLTELSIKRKSINRFQIEKGNISLLKWTPICTFLEKRTSTSLAGLFHRILYVRQKLTNSLISLQSDHPSNPSIETISDLSDILIELISKIFQLLSLIFQLNPTNSISMDHKYSDLSPTPHHQLISLHQSANNTSKDINNFYQKLINLHKNKYNKEKNNDLINNLEVGTISPFSIPMIYELHNIISIINKLPTHLIQIVMQINLSETMIPHDIVVKLSNSMNEVVQITNLFNMVKPFKIFDTDLNERTLGDYNDQDLIIKKEFMPQSQLNGKNEIMEHFIKSGWKLLDDIEFGWL